MGKKGRRTRWRTLTITDEHSDSEESNTTSSGHRAPKSYSQKSYYSRFTYSSQSTPTRRYQCDGAKSTRSSSTASENKITFNEDEYTRITTPRQDVLFKKGYLNKPKTYQTQTSTGNSTTSTGNSTGNGTPDHQSTDLEFESQFVFPNGFVDQNGIYYVNSFEPYPVMVYNPPTYYPEYTNVKTKRCSTGSLTESTSPHNDDTSQDLSQSETPSELNHHVYNVIYPGFYYNGVCQPQDVACDSEPRRVKKRRRRKLSRSKQEGTTSESSDEIFTDEEETKTEENRPAEPPKVVDDHVDEGEDAATPVTEVAETVTPSEEKESKKEEEPEADTPKEPQEDSPKDESEETKKYDLKPDAEEFVPRAYRNHPESTIPVEIPANVQFIKIPSNFVPVPILNPMGEFNAFIPQGIPINFIPQNYVNFIPYKHPVHQTAEEDEDKRQEEESEAEVKNEETKEAATVEVPNKTNKNQNPIDIAKIVSRLEEAAKEQDDIKEETKINNVRKRHKYQKVELPTEEKKWQTNNNHNKVANSPKRENLARPPRNYSDTLKKSMVTSQCDRHEKNVETAKVNKVETKNNIVKNHQRVNRSPPKISTEWISVSRKKRKNKNVEESEEVEEKTEVIESIQTPEEVIPTPEPEVVSTPEEVKPEVVITTEAPPMLEEKKEEQKVKTKKKSKKNHAKVAPAVVIKRVMITDMDLSVQEVKKEVEEIKTDEEPKIEETTQPEVVEEAKLPEEEVIVDVPQVDEKVEEEKIDDKKEPSEKKSKKKKKKVAPKSAILSSQSSSNTTLNVNDDSYDFLLDESLDKTNVEVSQELDKMIQRGMYSSLEEKIKSMNMESSDNFFKTIINNISSRESSVEKSNPYIKTPSFSRLIPIQSTQVNTPCDFLAEPTTPDTHVEGGAAPPAPDDDDDHLYPITRAVKEWMTKTRETTPDVEILKSPSAIFREFCDEDDAEDEVIFSHQQRKTSASSIEEGEDVVETYESAYGKNEDFLKIQAEVEEMKNGYPKHGNLPYRAICCSIM